MRHSDARVLGKVGIERRAGCGVDCLAPLTRSDSAETTTMPSPASAWIKVTPAGLHVVPGKFTIDPVNPRLVLAIPEQ